MSFEIKVQLDGNITEKLAQLQKRVQDLTPLMRQIGYTLIDVVEQNFETESFLGRPWHPLAESTKRQKAKKGYEKILQNRGMLAESVDFVATKDKLVLGTNVEYAAIHQFGGDAGKNHRAHIPARPFLPIDENAKLPQKIEDEIMDAVEFYVKNLLADL